MRELFEICQKIQFFNFLVQFFNFFLCVRMCQGQPRKIPCLSDEKMTAFPHLALFFHLSLPKMWHFHPLQNHVFEKYKNTTIITQNVILAPSNLLFLGAFENYLFFIIVLTIISEKHHVIKQLPW